jgi:hypothetical protein
MAENIYRLAKPNYHAVTANSVDEVLRGKKEGEKVGK